MKHCSQISTNVERSRRYSKSYLSCPPDKFEKDPEKKEIAQKLFAQIQNNRNDYTQLMELKSIVEVKLLND